MKAIPIKDSRPKVRLQGSGPFHGHKLRLTIGIIAKNEEKTLGKCLSSLKPLMDAVPSELIFTDTGSTDRTVEIAKKYTDHIINFKWCDDFSAARNTGIDAAQGEWFMFIDADEWFDDVTPIIGFFNSGECDSYNMAAYILRNYNDFQGKNYNDHYADRMVRLQPEIRFHNILHEDLPIYMPVKMLGAFVHHYGYAYHTKEEEEKHDRRNLALLKKELKRDPDDLKALAQASLNLIGSDDAKAADYARRGILAVQKLPERDRCALHYNARFEYIYFKALYNRGQYAKLIDELPEALKEENEPGVFHLEFYWLAEMSAYMLKDYAKAVEYGGKYLKMYKLYERGEIDRSSLMLADFHSNNEESRASAIILNGMALLKLGRTDEAAACAAKINFSAKSAAGVDSLEFCFELAEKSGDWSAPVMYYNGFRKLDDEGRIKPFLNYAEYYYYNYPEKRAQYLEAFAKNNSGDGYTLLCRLRLAAMRGDSRQADAQLSALKQQEAMWSVNESDALYYILKSRKNLMQYISKIEADDMVVFAGKISKMHDDFPSVMLDYADAFSFENPKALFCMSCCFKMCITGGSKRRDEKKYGRLVQAYMESIARCVHGAFRPEILNPSAVCSLPRECRFGYYAGEAIKAKRQGDGAGCIRNMRLGLKAYPAMKEPVEFLLSKFEAQAKSSEAKAREFRELGAQVKKNIELLIAKGDLKQAGIYTAQLAKLMPDDVDVRRYQKVTHTEPDMRELAARLPQ